MSFPETRPSLIVRLSDGGDEQAWREFLAAYEPFLLHLMRGRGLQDADARDAAQQVLLAVSGRVAEWTPDGRPSAFRRWLVTIARRAAIKTLVQAARHPRGTGGSAGGWAQLARDEADSRQEAAAAAAYQEEALAWALDQIRGEFRPTTWAAFWETVVRGRAVEDVSRELGLSTGALYMARSRVMARLRERVKQFDPDEEVPALREGTP